MNKRIIISIFLLLSVIIGSAQTRKVQNRPYIDQRIWHYGLFVGIHSQDLELQNNGFTTESGEQWFADVPSYTPGFQVGVLGELYLNKYMSLRFVPSLYFGDRQVVFHEQVSGKEERQSIKSAYVGVPLNVKFAAERFNNYRPYVVTGVNPMLNLSTTRRKQLLLKPLDCYIEIGLGCDIYMPFFKLIPELKFCIGLANILQKNRKDLTDLSMMKFTESVDKAVSRMIVLTFYFE